MRKINLCYFLFVGVLVSCTNTYDVCEMQRNETEDMSSRMAGDGVYDVLGFGYDITEDYLGENSTRLQVIDVKALIRDNGDRFYNPFIGTIDQKIVAGEDAQSFLQNVITDSNFKGSVAGMDIKKDAEGFFSGTLSAGFKSASKYSYSSFFTLLINHTYSCFTFFLPVPACPVHLNRLSVSSRYTKQLSHASHCIYKRAMV